MSRTKHCSMCKKRKGLSKFHRDASRHDGLNHRCRTCNTVHQRQLMARRRAKDPEGFRAGQRRYEMSHNYGITEDDYDKLFEKQGGVCAICGENPEGRLAVDHDHETKTVRGLLCRPCNSGLGFLGDSTDRVAKAAEYMGPLGEAHRALLQPAVRHRGRPPC